jgi:ABC-type glycerol-3-phosphate transport system substrate-binding protein
MKVAKETHMKSRKMIAFLCMLAVTTGCLTGCSKTAGKGRMPHSLPEPPHHTVAEEIIAAHENYVLAPIQPDENNRCLA